MGVGMPVLREIEWAGAITPERCTVLDLGPSYLHNATPADILYFFEKYPKRPLDDRLRAVAKELAERTNPKHPLGQTFLAEVFEHTSVRYDAIDVFPGPSTRLFDLNFDTVPRDMVGRYDLVLNFGTTEHVFGQYNAFKVIHEVLKFHGPVYHQLPSTGLFNHGYFKYHPRIFGELATANGYAVVELFVTEMPGHWSFEEFYTPPHNLADPTRFRETVKSLGTAAPGHANGLINAFLRKDRDGPFRLHLDYDAQVGAVNTLIAKRYGPLPARRKGSSPVRAVKWTLRKLGVKRALQAVGLR